MNDEGLADSVIGSDELVAECQFLDEADGFGLERHEVLRSPFEKEPV